MNMRQLQYFLAVASELNFTRASERVNIAQPALSAQIIALEEELGTPLFTREKRKVLLTPAGEILVENAQRVLNTANAAIAAGRGSGRGARAELGRQPAGDDHLAADRRSQGRADRSRARARACLRSQHRDRAAVSRAA